MKQNASIFTHSFFHSLRLIAVICFLSLSAGAWSQQRNITLTISATTNTGESLAGQAVSLTQTDYSLSYGDLTLGSNATLSVKVYPGHHSLSITRAGYDTYTSSFVVSHDTTVVARLSESTQTPYSLSTSVVHNAHTGLNDVTLTWNSEKPVFFDDFESYEAFSTTFGDWTGIDRDHLTAAPLAGSYPNRGVFEYAQIINPMVVEPTWWYDYPILRPYGGLQYVGFIRTGSNEANDDWLISPTITPGNENVLQFYARAADQYDEKFQVYVTTKTDNPSVEDFTMISAGNYDAVNYRSWQLKTYDLSQYAGRPIKFAIRYLGNLNGSGAFMLMVDNVYVGQRPLDALQLKSRRVSASAERSPRNPNEVFHVFLNGTEAGTTEDYSYTFADLPQGTYQLGVQSVYKASSSPVVDTTITIGGQYAAVNFSIATNNHQTVDGSILTLTDKSSGDVYTDTIQGSVASFPSLPFGSYLVELNVEHFQPYNGSVDVSGDATVPVSLIEQIVDPYNLTADLSQSTNGYDVALRWNQNLSFEDSFESYPDFATGSFGGWTTYDLDQHVCYPISLNGSIINFPGASTTTAPSAVPPLVFNPKTTTPPMTADAAVLAPDGDKTIIFFSPQQNGANKWLVSPQQTIRDRYVVRFAVKSYTDAYGYDQMEVAVSTTGNDPQTSTFNVVSTISRVPAGQWTFYETDLSQYAGQDVYIGVHYISYDCFFTQLDQFFVGNPDGNDYVDVGSVDHYNIYLDGTFAGTTAQPSYNLTGVSAGSHTVEVEAVYASGTSAKASITIDTTTGIASISAPRAAANAPLYNLCGQRVGSGYRGIVVSEGRKMIKR